MNFTENKSAIVVVPFGLTKTIRSGPTSFNTPVLFMALLVPIRNSILTFLPIYFFKYSAKVTGLFCSLAVSTVFTSCFEIADAIIYYANQSKMQLEYEKTASLMYVNKYTATGGGQVNARRRPVPGI